MQAVTGTPPDPRHYLGHQPVPLVWWAKYWDTECTGTETSTPTAWVQEAGGGGGGGAQGAQAPPVFWTGGAQGAPRNGTSTCVNKY